MKSENKSLNRGSPWKHKLEIKELENNFLKADVSLAGESWVLVTSIVSFILAIGLLGVVWISLSKTLGGAITAGVFAVIFLTLSLLFMGCYSYCAELIVDESHVKFSKCFFWKWKMNKQIRNGHEFVQCWDHVLGTGTHSEYSFNLCLHMDEPFPVVCLYSINYRSNIKDQVMKKVGLPGGELKIEDEALEDILVKAEEVAEYLKVENRPNFKK